MIGFESEFPIISMVDNLIAHAIIKSASDIHFEPMEHHMRVRLRIDGVLYDHDPVNPKIMQQMIARLKVLAAINIAEKRVPQDGKFRIMRDGKEIDLRVSTFPTIHGEKVVLRILNRLDYTTALATLGFSATLAEQIQSLLKQSNGFFLVSGPTGSGKTTTLYASLAQLSTPEKNIVTLEDPVEYCVPGICQAQIHPDAGFTFEKGIRSLLRQDPDVVMVGEIRDKQTAGIAIEAALTGHLVLSTIHTNDAPSVVMRLMDMGIEPFLINAAVSGVLAQRLARRICTHCKIERTPTAQEQAILEKYQISLSVVFSGLGCQQCANLGMKGRIGIFEFLSMTEQLRSLIVQHPSFSQISAQAKQDGMQTLMQDGLQKVSQGIITVSEMLRVVI